MSQFKPSGSLRSQARETRKFAKSADVQFADVLATWQP